MVLSCKVPPLFPLRQAAHTALWPALKHCWPQTLRGRQGGLPQCCPKSPTCCLSGAVEHVQQQRSFPHPSKFSWGKNKINQPINLLTPSYTRLPKATTLTPEARSAQQPASAPRARPRACSLPSAWPSTALPCWHRGRSPAPSPHRAFRLLRPQDWGRGWAYLQPFALVPVLHGHWDRDPWGDGSPPSCLAEPNPPTAWDRPQCTLPGVCSMGSVTRNKREQGACCSSRAIAPASAPRGVRRSGLRQAWEEAGQLGWTGGGSRLQHVLHHRCSTCLHDVPRGITGHVEGRPLVCSGHLPQVQPTALSGSTADPSVARRQNSLLARCSLAAFGGACRHRKPEGRLERLQTYQPLAPRPGTRVQIAGTRLDQTMRAPSHQGTPHGPHATRPTHADAPHAQGKGMASQSPCRHQEMRRAVQDCAKTQRAKLAKLSKACAQLWGSAATQWALVSAPHLPRPSRWKARRGQTAETESTLPAPGPTHADLL